MTPLPRSPGGRWRSTPIAGSRSTGLLRLPNTDVVFLFALLRNAIPPTPERAAELVEDNRQLFDAAVSAGGFSYPIDSVPKTLADWQAHYGPLWPAFALAKRVYDPDEILTPGQGIFAEH